MNSEEERVLLRLFKHKDTLGSGELTMDQIREVFSYYCSKLVEKE